MALAIISVSGLSYGGKAAIPGAFALGILVLIGSIIISGRRSMLDKSPELKTKPFKEFRLFILILERKLLKIADSFESMPRKSLIREHGRLFAGSIIIILMVTTFWSSFSISADIASLKKNQALVVVDPNDPQAYIFDGAVIIDLIQTSADPNGQSAKVTAKIRSEGYEELLIKNVDVGYETTYSGPAQFIIKVSSVDANRSSATFFVERIRK